jgi:hypothetical protein
LIPFKNPPSLEIVTVTTARNMEVLPTQQNLVHLVNVGGIRCLVPRMPSFRVAITFVVTYEGKIRNRGVLQINK